MRAKTLALAMSLSVSLGFDVRLARAEAPRVTAGSNEKEETAVAKSVTLDEAVRRALARNPTTEVAAKEIDRAEGLMKQVRAGWLPTLDANATYTRLDADRELNGRVILSANQFNANLRLNLPLIAPRQWVRYSQSKVEVSVARAGLADARREVALAAARAYLTVVAQHRVLRTARGALKNTRAHENYTTTRFSGGVGNRLDAARASQERAAAEVRVLNQLTQLTRAQEALGVVIGEEGAVDAAQDPALDVPVSIDSALSEVNSRRADIAAQRDRVELARKVAQNSWAEYLPVLTAVASPFYQNPPTFTNPSTGWTAQLVLGIPIFDGGARYGLTDERRALEGQARARLEGVLRQARSEVRMAFEAMRRADEALVAAQEAAKLGKEALGLAQLAYEAGATSNIEVVDAERRSHDAETAAAVAEDASRQARLDLLSACGRFP
jgi:outer membrane protein